MNCPRCNTHLKSEDYEHTEIDRCPSCGGTWLDAGELSQIVNIQEKKFTPEFIHETLLTAYRGISEDEKRSIVCCPICKIAMKAVNYDYKSGIIIDSCPKGHGVWLDHRELEKVQAYREYFQAETIKHKGEWLALLSSVEIEKNNLKDENNKRNMRPTKYLFSSILRKMIGK